ncbi:MAG: T9SS type A sorting domain-containing protein [Flavobacteriales bacterium]|nr:T9SS type A sorting domain-containing protein [Flavobacteriales bacterium]
MKTLVRVFAFALLAQPLVGSAQNDDCAGALAIACGQSIAGNTDSAAVDTVPFFCGTGIEAAGIWYTFTGDGGYMNATTCNANGYDTRINVYSGSCGSLACVGGNDDAQFCDLASTVTFLSTNGSTYYILVQGYDGETGDFTLTLNCTACPVAQNVSVSPSNDEVFIDWTSLLPGDFSVEYGPAGFALGTGAVASGTIGTDGPPVNITGLADSTEYDYYITLDCGSGNVSLASGPYTFTTLDLAPPANAFCADALTIACGDSLDGTTVNSIVTPAPECGSANVNTAGVWYSFTGNGQEVTLSTCGNTNYDSKIGVYTGPCTGLVCIAGNDDGPNCPGNSSITTFVSELGIQYLVLVHGYNGATGNFTLIMSCEAPCSPSLANDDCDAATALTTQPIGQCAPVVATLVCAYASPLPNPGCDPYENVNDAWFMFNTGNEASHTIITTLGDAATLNLALYTACSEPQYIQCFTDSVGPFNFTGLDLNTDYLVRIWNGGGTEAGDFTICDEAAIPDAIGESTSADVLVYPVPAADEVFITGLPAAIDVLLITDLAGRIVAQMGAPRSDLVRLDVSRLAAGTYMLKAVDADATIIARFAVQR